MKGISMIVWPFILFVGSVQLTEVYQGCEGPDAGDDCFELTNLGSETVTVADYRYDDESANYVKSQLLSTVTLEPGESAIWLVKWESQWDTQAQAAANFRYYWPEFDGKVGWVLDGSGIGQAGDEVHIWDGSGAFVDALVVPSSGGERTRTPQGWSQLGVGGAFQSRPAGDAQIPCIGSPGVYFLPGDTNGDAYVNVNDLLAIIAGWAQPAGAPMDQNGDGLIGIDDLLIVLSEWGS
tara:strand:- start:1288 stop:1998 length:711 start_codon:yes stop_codon:yes gene_type:complete